jgi:hypothetical protein
MDMTENDWLTSTDSTAMMEFVRARGILSERKKTLFWTASGRLFWNLYPHEASRKEIEVAERHADGRATDEELDAAHREAQAGIRATYSLHPSMMVDGFAVLPDLIRDMFGNPFRTAIVEPSWLVWNGGTVVKIAQGVYDDRAFDRLPVLADALEDAGCHDADILGHCRHAGPHVRGCWVVDLLTGRT